MQKIGQLLTSFRGKNARSRWGIKTELLSVTEGMDGTPSYIYQAAITDEDGRLIGQGSMNGPDVPTAQDRAIRCAMRFAGVYPADAEGEPQTVISAQSPQDAQEEAPASPDAPVPQKKARGRSAGYQEAARAYQEAAPSPEPAKDEPSARKVKEYHEEIVALLSSMPGPLRQEWGGYFGRKIGVVKLSEMTGAQIAQVHETMMLAMNVAKGVTDKAAPSVLEYPEEEGSPL